MNIENVMHGMDPTKKVDWTDLKNNRDTLNPSAPVARRYRP